MTSEPKKLALSYRETGAALGICERSAWTLVKSGKLQSVNIGRSVRIPVSEVERFLSEATPAEADGEVSP